MLFILFISYLPVLLFKSVLFKTLIFKSFYLNWIIYLFSFYQLELNINISNKLFDILCLSYQNKIISHYFNYLILYCSNNYNQVLLFEFNYLNCFNYSNLIIHNKFFVKLDYQLLYWFLIILFFNFWFI